MTPVIQALHDGHGLARYGLRNGDVNQRMERQTLSPEGGPRSRDPANRAHPLVAPRDRGATWAKANSGRTVAVEPRVILRHGGAVVKLRAERGQFGHPEDGGE
jgi:hypothetical protein